MKKILFYVFSLISTILHSNNLYIGKGTYGSPNVHDWGQGTKCVIGKYCSLGHDIIIQLGGNHRGDWITTYPFPAFKASASHIKDFATTKGDVIIGNDVWISSGVCVLSGVKIGDGAIIGTKAVVTKDVPPYAVAVGNPAKVVKYRFTQDIIQKLLQIAWWNWEDSQIDACINLLLSNDVELFIKYCEVHGLL